MPAPAPAQHSACIWQHVKAEVAVYLVLFGCVVQLDAETGKTISSDVKEGAVKFRVIGQDTGDYRGTSVNRTIGSTISFRFPDPDRLGHTLLA